MPAGLIHEVVSKKLENYLNISSNEFYVGSVAPDSWRNSTSTKEESHFYLNGINEPNYEYFYNKYKNHILNDYVLGYFIHLITDYYWYSNNYTNRNESNDNYKQLLYELRKRHNIKNINPINENNFFNPIEELETSGINITIKYLEGVPEEPNKEVNLDKIEKEIGLTVEFIKKELKKYGIKKDYKIKPINIFKHFHIVNKHRWNVFKLCCKAGIPLQGLVHDLSKYSTTEFWESVKYYEGTYSPIRNCKLDIGYSEAWLHHKGRNKHHYEYWYDYSLSKTAVLMPLKYFKEMICDSFAAGIVYQGKNWKPGYQLEYWNKVKGKARIHPAIMDASDEIYYLVSKKGLSYINKKHLEEIYYKNLNKYN